MFTTSFRSGLCSPRRSRRAESGMALFMVLLLIVIVTVIGLGLLAMSDTETMVNGNYKDTQLAFFAMRSGLEEVRNRMRINAANTITGGNCTSTPCLPSAVPGNANSILYILNPAAGETVDPTSASGGSNPQYFDGEFCHEHFYSNPNGASTILTDAGTGIPCPSTSGPSSAWAMKFNSTSPGTGTAAALKYKWVRVTLKQNGSVPNSVVDASQGLGVQVCFQTFNNQEIPLTLVPGYSTSNYASCAVAKAAGQDAGPVYLVTSLAVTPQGSRRIGQFEVAGYTITPPPAGLGLDGPGVNFGPPDTSNNFSINGNDSGTGGFAGPGSPVASCPGPAQVPAISEGDNPSVTNTDNAIPQNRWNNYTGTASPNPPAPTPPPTPPSVVNEGPAPGLGGLTGVWSNPAQLNQLVNNLANVADTTYSSCSMYGNTYNGNGSPCTPSGTIGTDANPQITFVNGDFNMSATSGAGVLVVTGTLTAKGVPAFDGLILVIGQGNFQASGGGSGTFNGTIFIAQTNSHTAPYGQLATMGAPAFGWNGGGTNSIQYNSCWANLANQLEYNVLATREEMY